MRPTRATVRMTVRADMVNGFGVCHGGIVFSLADSALAFASNTHGHVTVSIENSITLSEAAIVVGDVLDGDGRARRASTNRLGVLSRDRAARQDEIVRAVSRHRLRTTQQHSFDQIENEQTHTSSTVFARPSATSVAG